MVEDKSFKDKALTDFIDQANKYGLTVSEEGLN